MNGGRCPHPIFKDERKKIKDEMMAGSARTRLKMSLMKSGAGATLDDALEIWSSIRPLPD